MGRFHPSNLGLFGNSLPTDREGYVVYSEQEYKRATKAASLDEMPEGLTKSRRSAWLVVNAERQLAKWRKENP